MPQNRQYIAEDFFIYDITLSPVLSGSSVGNINIDADSDFQFQKATYFADISAAPQTNNSRVIPIVDIIITDTGSGRQLMNEAVPIANLFGTGQIPFILPQPKLFNARSTIQVSVSNRDTVNGYTLKLSFIGKKLFLG